MTTPRFSPDLTKPFLLPGAIRYQLTSAKNLRYDLFITEPTLPPPPSGYPVIYVLDGNATFATTAEALRLQTKPPYGMDAAIVVAIGYEGDQPFVHTSRYRDFTTPADPATLPQRKSDEPWPVNGGADAFADLIETEIKPLIASRYPVDPARQTLFGHSLGGFFTLHCLFTRPQSFAAFFAGSPSLWWHKGELFSRLPAFEQALTACTIKPRLTIGFGANELDDMRADGHAMAQHLRALPDFDFRYVEIEGEEHITVLPALLSRLVAFALSPQGNPTR